MLHTSLTNFNLVPGETHLNFGLDLRKNCLNGISIALAIHSLDRIKRITLITRIKAVVMFSPI